MRTHRIPPSGRLRALEVRNRAGSVTVQAVEDTDEVVVLIDPLDDGAEELAERVDVVVTDAQVRVSVPERRLLRTPSFAITISTPPGAAVRVAAGSADVQLRGRLGRAQLTSASGDVDVEHCAELQARAASGDTRIGAVEGTATIGSASGDVRLGTASGTVQVRTASGDVEVDEFSGDLSVTTASGDIAVGRVARGTVRLRTASGDATVGVAPGRRLWLDLRSVSGRLASDLDPEPAGHGPVEQGRGADADGGPPLSVLLQSVSGDLRVRRASPAAPAR